MPGNAGAPVPVALTTRVAEFNDLDGVERTARARRRRGDPDRAGADQHRHRAAGARLPGRAARAGHPVRRPADDRRDAHDLRRSGRRHPARGACSRTSSSSARASAAASRAAPTASPSELARGIGAHPEADLVDVGGVGGTLAGNALSVAAMRATLEHVLTDEAFDADDRAGHRVHPRRAGRRSTRTALPWSVSQLGARSEYRFASPAPRTGPSRPRPTDDDLDEYLHLYLANRGVLITPFHNMALMCPDTVAGRRRPAHPAVRRRRRRAGRRRRVGRGLRRAAGVSRW